MAGFDIEGARKAGYTDAEIVSHLAQDKNASFDFAGASQAGYTPTEILKHIGGGEKSTGYIDAAKQGVSNLIGGVGETLHQYGAPGIGGDLEQTAKEIAPKNYEPAHVLSHEEGLKLGNIPRAVVENAPGMAASIAAARAVPGPAWLKLLAGSGMYALQTLGHKAKARAVNNTGDQNAEPTTGDKIAAAAAVVPEAAIGIGGLNRFMPGVGSVTAVGKRGVIDAVKHLAKTAGIEGATFGVQNAVSQAGNTLGTERGLHVDPYEVGNSALIATATGGTLALPKAAGEINGAIKYRNFGGANERANASNANDIATKAGGVGNLKPGLIFDKSKAGFEAVSRAQADNTSRLTEQLSALKKTTQLTPQAKTAFDLLREGRPLTEADHAAITQSVGNAPNGDLVSFLARKAALFNQLERTGAYSPKTERFTGGVSGTLFTKARENVGKTALAAGIGGLGEASHLIAFSPAMIAALTGGAIASRVVDRMTGNLNPAWRYTTRFADPNVVSPTVRQPAPLSTMPNNMGPWGQRPMTPVVPNVAQPEPTALAKPPAGFGPTLQAYVRQQNRTDRAGDKQTVMQAMPLIAKLAALQNQPQSPAPGLPAAPVNPVLPDAGIPKDVMARSRALMRGLQAVNKLKQKATEPLEETPHPGGAETDQAKIRSVVKANGTIGVNDEPFPASSYAHMLPHEAANKIAKMQESAGNVKYFPGYRASTRARIIGERAAMTNVGNEVPGLPIKEITARLEGVPDQKTAIAFREYMKEQYPQAAPAFDKHLSDGVIKQLWKVKGK